MPPGGRLAGMIAEASDEVARAAPHLGFLAEAEPGSNAWAVSGRRTAHGGAVLCNDSHRALDTPNVYWQCHLSCPDFDVIGAAFAGVPGFPHFGHNGHVAWAITHGSADTQDLYLEQFDHRRPGWYRTETDGGKPASAQRRSWCAELSRSPPRCGRPGTARSCTAIRAPGWRSRSSTPRRAGLAVASSRCCRC